MGEMSFSFKDLYPNMGITETSTEVIPDSEDMDVLNEDKDNAEKADKSFARGKNILIACGVLVALVVFLGGGE